MRIYPVSDFGWFEFQAWVLSGSVLKQAIMVIKKIMIIDQGLRRFEEQMGGW